MKIPFLSPLISRLTDSGKHIDSPSSWQHGASSKPGTIDGQHHFSLLRAKWANYFLGDSELPFAPPLHTQMAKIDRQAKHWLSTFELDQQGLWYDLPLDANSPVGRMQLGIQLHATYQRIFMLARAYKQPNGELVNHPVLHNTLIESLAFLHDNFYHVGAAEWGDWWYWQIGINHIVSDTLVILYDDLPQEVLNNYIDASRYFVPRATHLSEGYGAPYSSAPTVFQSRAEQRIENAQAVLIRGILDNEEKDIQAAMHALSNECSSMTAQWNVAPVLTVSLAMIMGLVADSPWQAPEHQLQKIYSQLLAMNLPTDIDAPGNDIGIKTATSHIRNHQQKINQTMLSTQLLYLAGAPTQHRSQLAESLKTQLLSGASLPAQPQIFTCYQIAKQLVENMECAERGNGEVSA
ncbi:hypothetical protein ACFFLZ_09080 [Photobacterium aphoticum]|uniref:hypothetical protein n=1 Tax=Photobacterium aphoticum TaxID=754436 RepID=UPI000A583222|nr:hypothetical protein [Photobacterium aphoticum]